MIFSLGQAGSDIPRGSSGAPEGSGALPTMPYHKQGKTPEWETPQDFFDKLDAEFGFYLDVCATRENAKCGHFFTREDDGLNRKWCQQVCWMNPPYGREIREWMKKAWDESQRGSLVVCLVPARTDSGWWHDYAARGEVRFVRGRLRFSGSKVNAPFPCAVVIFRPFADRPGIGSENPQAPQPDSTREPSTKPEDGHGQETGGEE